MKDPQKSLANTIHKIIGETLQREVPIDIYGLTSIHHIKVTKGFEYVDIYIQTLDGNKDVLAFLRKNTQRFTGVLYTTLRRKSIPEIRWHYDDSGMFAEKIERFFAS